MNGCVAHRARLVFGGLIVPGTGRPLRGKRMTLQAQQVHLAHTQIARISRPVGSVTAATALGLYWNVFIDEGPHLVCMAFSANRIPARHGSYLPESGGAVNIVAITAVDETLIHAMVIGLGEISFRRGVAPVTEIWLVLHKQVLRFLGVMRGVTIQAANVIARVRGCGEMTLLALPTMTGQTTHGGVLR